MDGCALDNAQNGRTVCLFPLSPGQEISKWHLADLFWPDMDEVRASHNLHNAVYRLKKLLKEQGIDIEIRKVNDGYLMDPGNLVYDVLQFERNEQRSSSSEQDLAHVEHLVSLYKGPLLERKDYLWKAPLEEGYRKRFMMLVCERIQQDLAAQEWDKAEIVLEKYLNVYALDEEMNLALLQLYENSGRNKRTNDEAL